MRFSPKNKKDVYHVDGVPGRTDIEIHPANLMGNSEKGYVAELLGCIALGLSVRVFQHGVPPAGGKDQKGVTASRVTVEAFEKAMEKKDFDLVIQ